MKSAKNKKKFKETKVGAFLTERAPQVLSQVGEFLPDQGALGVVKNIISKQILWEMIKTEVKQFAMLYNQTLMRTNCKT